tara:strand:- start:2192 stop:3043 length:852 start_codon:yes stop_codon:yes gene_type:complete
MPAPKVFNNVIIGQFALTGVPVKVYASNRFLSITDTDDIEDPTVGFGMDEHGEMIQFSYPEVEFLQVQGNKIDLATYNKGMESLHGGDEAPADKEPDANKEEEGDEESGGMFNKDKKEEGIMKLKDLIKESFLGQLPSERNMMKMKYNPLSEISSEEVDAEMEAAQSEIDAAKAKEKAAKAAVKDTVKGAKDKIKAAKASMKVAEEGYDVTEAEVVPDNHYTFGTGDIVNDRDPGCPHFGSKGIVIELPAKGEVRYSVTNGDQTKSYRPGDMLTKRTDQLEKI